MNAENTHTAPHTAENPTRGFGQLHCFNCGDETAMRLFLDDVTMFTCPECDGEFTIDDVKAHLAQWGKVLAWIDMAPLKPE